MRRTESLISITAGRAPTGQRSTKTQLPEHVIAPAKCFVVGRDSAGVVFSGSYRGEGQPARHRYWGSLPRGSSAVAQRPVGAHAPAVGSFVALYAAGVAAIGRVDGSPGVASLNFSEGRLVVVGAAVMRAIAKVAVEVVAPT